MRSWDDGKRIRAVRHPAQLGKGRAVRTALEHARGELVLIQDADMEYDPRDYVRLLQPLVNGRAKVVYGTRTFASHTAYSFWYVIGNKGVTTAANLLYNVYLSDIQTAYKVFPRKAGLAMNLEASGFDIDPEITAKLLRMGYRIHEVPVDYIARSREEGKKVKPSDGVKALLTLSRHRMWRPRATAASLAAPSIEAVGRDARRDPAAASRR
jgi:glycosyltransferase involved in cell wall biosynthesis